MHISKDTKVSVVIKHNKEAIDVIASLNSHFEKLRNPILRKLLAPRVTLADAARIGKCDLNVLLSALEGIGFTADFPPTDPLTSKPKQDESPMDLDTPTVTFDIRPLLHQGVDPFNQIMETLKGLKKGDSLCVISPFEPTPLIRILSEKGYVCHVSESNDLFETRITRQDLNSQTTESSQEPVPLCTAGEFNMLCDRFLGKIVALDVRELEMPQPMIAILEQLSELQPGYALLVQHKRIPQYLLPELEERMFKIVAHEKSGFHFQLLIHRKSESTGIK